MNPTADQLRKAAPDEADGRPVPGGRAPAVAVVGALALVVVVALWGQALTRHGARLHLSGGAPLTGALDPRLPPATVLPVMFAALGVWLLPRMARRARWPVLVVITALASAGWALALAVTDGWSAVGAPLTTRYEYLHDLHLVHGLHPYLAGFVDHVAARSPGWTWTTHVGGHPPGALLPFVALDRLGLSGATSAGLLCIAVGASGAAAVLVAVRALGGEQPARAAAPFVVLSPLALWVATSADALFAGVAAWGVCALACATRHRGPRCIVLAGVSGVLLAAAAFLSYGLVLMGVIAAAVVLACRRPRLLIALCTGGLLVVATFRAAGFWWPEGLVAAAGRVRDGPASRERPAVFFAVAGAAALALALGPAVVGGGGRYVVDAVRGRNLLRTSLGAAAALPVGAVSAVLAATASGLSKGEVERIWLPFALWLLPLTALLAPRQQRAWLAAAAGAAVFVQLWWRLRW